MRRLDALGVERHNQPRLRSTATEGDSVRSNNLKNIGQCLPLAEFHFAHDQPPTATPLPKSNELLGAVTVRGLGLAACGRPHSNPIRYGSNFSCLMTTDKLLLHDVYARVLALVVHASVLAPVAHQASLPCHSSANATDFDLALRVSRLFATHARPRDSTYVSQSRRSGGDRTFLEP